MLANLGRDDIITDDVLKAIEPEVGGDGDLPDSRRRAYAISKALDGAPFPVNLYWRMYVPLSEFFVHTNGVSLLRHVGTKDEILDEPLYPWARRCAVRTADGCMGLVAAAIANAEGHPNERLANYADDHLNRALAPLAIVSGKSLFRSLGPAKIAGLVKGVVDLRAYFVSGRADTDTWDARVHNLRSWFDGTSVNTARPPRRSGISTSAASSLCSPGRLPHQISPRATPATPRLLTTTNGYRHPMAPHNNFIESVLPLGQNEGSQLRR
jgi:hypothetical protein